VSSDRSGISQSGPLGCTHAADYFDHNSFPAGAASTSSDVLGRIRAGL
jgi:hypothetical protein